MADYYQVKNQNIFNPPANTFLGNTTNQYNSVYVQNDLVLGNVTVTGSTIIAPRITTIAYPGDDTAADTAGGQTITITGTGFVAGASVLINGSAVGVVAVVSSTTITIVSPANTTGSYVVYVINPDGSTAIAIPGIQYSGTPTWTTSAGTLGNVYETASFTQTVTATGDAPITYSVASGSIPPGSTFNANGTITGTSQLSSSPTTYSFTVRATDAQLQDTDRAFSIAVIPDVVTWSSPTDNATYTPATNVAIANITLSATSAVGSGITYTANTLPTGLSLTGANISGTPTVTANSSTLLTATANTTSELSSITINWSVSVASDPYFMYNTLLLPGTGSNGAQNNTFLDGSTNNFTITRNGNTTQGTFSPYGPNWSNYFDGVGDYLSFPNNAVFAFGTGSFTIEFWVNGPLATDKFFLTGRQAIGTMLITTGGYESTAGVLRYVGTSTIVSSNVIMDNTWHHCAIVRNGSSNITLYVDGVSVGTGTDTSNYTNTTGIWYIASNDTSGVGQNLLTGYISNLRIVKGTALYTSNFTPNTTPLTAIANTALLTCADNRLVDDSINNLTITKYGDVSVQRFSPFSPTAAYSAGTIGGSGYFDGSGDWLSIPNNSALNMGSSDFTYECWLYPTSIPNAYQTFIEKRTGGGYSSVLLALKSTGKYSILVASNAGTWGIADESTINVVLNTWQHIAVVRSGSTFSVYLNGIRLINTSIAFTVYDDGAVQGIGAGDSSGAQPYYGFINDVRIVKGTALYTGATYTVPTAPLTAIANTSLLANFTNAGIIDNTMINNLETVGNAQISTAQTKFGGGSMYFDGTGDYLTMPNSPQLNLGSANFTIEMWTYNTGNAGTLSLFYKAGSFELKLDSSRWVWQILPSSNIFVQNGTLTTNTWVHVALVRNGATTTLYINGTSYATGTSVNAVTNTNPFQIGFGAGGTFTGYIDDFRFTNGVARYTANFTPATSAFPTY